jgi:hypothetical protein
MKYWKVAIRWPNTIYKDGIVFKWGRTPEEARQYVKDQFRGNKGPIEIMEITEVIDDV